MLINDRFNKFRIMMNEDLKIDKRIDSTSLFTV